MLRTALRTTVVQIASLSLFICLMFGFVGEAFAQAPNPSPTASPSNDIIINVPATENNVSSLAIRAIRLLTVFRDEVERPLLDYFAVIASALFILIAIVYFLRLCWENDGLDGALLGRFILRFAVCAFLMGTIISIMWTVGQAGQQIAYGYTDVHGERQSSWLGQLAARRRGQFNLAYYRFSQGQFTVTVNGRPRDLTDPGDGTVTILGVTKNRGISLESLTDAGSGEGVWSDPVTWFKTLGLMRLFTELANLFNVYMWHFVVIGLELLAYFAIAAGMDRGGLATRITKNWAWGFIAIALIMPPVTQILSIFAFTFGALALQVGDRYVSANYWDANTITVVKSLDAPGLMDQQWLMVIVAGIGMFLAGCMMLSSIVIAYQITMGRVYESVSSNIGSWMSTAASSVVGLWSASTASALSRQAEQATVQGAHAAEGTSLKADRAAADKTVRGGAVASRAGAHAEWTEKVGDARASESAAASRAGIAHGRTDAEADAAFARTLTESDAELTAGRVTARNAADQQRSGLTGNISDMFKGANKPNEQSITGTGMMSGEYAPMLDEKGKVIWSGGLETHPSKTAMPTAPTGGGRYGAPRDYNRDGVRNEQHTGDDYNRAQGFGKGTGVGVAGNGVVAWKGNTSGYGNRVVVRHPDGRYTTYSHLQDGSTDNLQIGQALKYGDTVGRVGNTGSASRGHHLHFEAGTPTGKIKANGEPELAKISPRANGIAPVRRGVNEEAAMPTQTEQAMNYATEIKQEGALRAAGEHTTATKQISRDFMLREQRIARELSGSQQRTAGHGYAVRLGGINQQESYGLEANRLRLEGGERASAIRHQAGMEAARLRALGQIIAASGSTVAQGVGRAGEVFRY